MLLLGVLAAQAEGAPAVTSDYDFLESEILASAETSVSFTSLVSTYGSDYQHLQLRIVSRDSGGSTNGTALKLNFNSDTASNYSFHRLTSGNGSPTTGVTSSANANTDYIFLSAHPANGDRADFFGGTIVDIQDAFETTKYSVVKSLSGWNTIDYDNVWLASGLWQNTNAIDTITLTTASTGFAANSRISLYGLKAA